MIIFEPQCIGFVHVEVNAAYIISIRKAFPLANIDFIGEFEHLEMLKNRLKSYSENITFTSIEIPNPNHSYFNRLFVELKNIYYVYSLLKKKKTNLFVLSITSATLLGIKIFGIGLKQKVLIVVHGILETIKRSPEGLLKKLFWFKYYLVLCNRKNLLYIFNSEFIENNVLELYPSLKFNSVSIDLPYIFDVFIQKENKILEFRKIILGSAGVASVSKGSQYIFKLANDVLLINKKTNIEFIYIGHFVDPVINNFVNDNVTIPSKEIPLSKFEYEKYFLSIDYLVLFYPHDSYSFGISGVFLDAVKYEKPIIAIKSKFFDYYFGKYGKLGWLCKDYNEVLELVLDLTKGNRDEERKIIISNFRKIKSDISDINQINRIRKVFA